MEFCIYSTIDGEIVMNGTCEDADIHYQPFDSFQGIYTGLANPATQKIDLETLLPVDKSEDEMLLYKYNLVKDSLPNFNNINNLSDTELDGLIADYYFGQVDTAEWRIENYAVLRSAAYPDEKSEKTDAEVKIGSGIPEYVEEGELQLKKYYEDCIDVKIRFPKE